MYEDWIGYFSDNELNKLFKAYKPYKHIVKDSWNIQKYNDGILKSSIVDLKTFLPNNLLAYGDAMSMANSLEARVPYLDHELVEFAAGIPAKLKLNRFTPKYILKQALKDKIPRQILNRSKAGFNIPIGKWLRRELKGLLTDILCPESLKKIGYFNRPYIKELIDGHLSFKKDNGYKLLSLMHFCLWHDKFIKCGN